MWGLLYNQKGKQMNKLRLKADLIDKGVAEETDQISIYQSKSCGETTYINVLGESGDHYKSFYYSRDKLTFISGTHITPREVETMNQLDLESY